MPSAARLGRGTAGRQIGALVREFSDDLLADEQATFDKIDMRFAREVPRLRTATKDALKKADGEPSRLRPGSTLGTTLRAAHDASRLDSVDLTAALADVSHDKALAAIEQELLLCERTLAARFEGMTATAIAATRKTRAVRVARHMALNRKAVADLTRDFMTDVGIQFREAVDERTLLLRLYSLDPAGLRGFGGRGIWWRTVTEAKTSARTVSIGVANETRIDAMRAFNDEYDRLEG